METVSDETEFLSFLERCHEALTSQSHGDSTPYLSLWSREDDVAFMAPMGGYQLGFEQVSGLLSAAATVQDYETFRADNLVTVVSGGSAHTVEIERIARRPDPERKSEWPDQLTLRVTCVYRREKESWKVVLRHANIYQDLDFPIYTARIAHSKTEPT
jgi:ketosteroid isomerase-like protein